MSVSKPSLTLLRSLTGEHVLRALMAHERLTRAETAELTGISKPTVAEGMRRLEEAGLVSDTGERSTGRGRSGSYYALAETAGRGVVVDLAPGAVMAESLDAHGTVRAAARVELADTVDARRLASTLRTVVRRVLDPDVPVRTVVVSAADPVDRASGRLVSLPDAPFLVGSLDPVAVLAPLVGCPIHVDNDVNWAARAEQEGGLLADPDNFVYLHLGRGVGCAVVCDGRVWRGHSGLAGEIAHVTTRGPDGAPRAFTETFAELGLRRAGTSSIDVDRLRRRCLAATPDDPIVDQLADAISDVCRAVIALADPATIVLGGPWGTLPPVLDSVAEQLAGSARPVPVVGTRVTQSPSFAGARSDCLVRLRDAVVERQ